MYNGVVFKLRNIAILQSNQGKKCFFFFFKQGAHFVHLDAYSRISCMKSGCLALQRKGAVLSHLKLLSTPQTLPVFLNMFDIFWWFSFNQLSLWPTQRQTTAAGIVRCTLMK